MKLKNLIAVFVFVAVSMLSTVCVYAGATLPPELDFVSETAGLPENWESYRKTFEAMEHPFLLANKSDFERLRSVQDTEPWKSLKENAVYTVTNGMQILVPKTEKSTDWNNFASLIGANGLLYILDDANGDVYKDNIVSLMKYWDKNEAINLYDAIYTQNGDYWTTSIPPGNAIVNTLVALDIIHPNLTEAEINYCETVIGEAAQKFFDHTETHEHNTYGIRAIWAAYIKDYDLLYKNYSAYMVHFSAVINDEGYNIDAVGYGWGRFATDGRLGKMIAPVIVKKMGISDHFFTWEPSINFAESLLSYSRSPNGTQWVLGDTRFTKTARINTSETIEHATLPFYASYFGETAAANGAWFLKNLYIYPEFKVGTLVSYLLCETPISEASVPKSTVFNHGGAFLYENMDNKNSIAGVLHNLGVYQTSGHGHNETNSFSVSAYGQMLLANSGYMNFGLPAGKFDWLYIHGRAYSSNTVLIDYDPVDIYNPTTANDHLEKGENSNYPYGSGGAGITGSLITDLFAYASGDTGEDRNTLPNGRHIRNAAMIGTQDGVPGYFAVLDEISSDSPEVNATVMWRPVSDDYTAVDSDSFKWHVSAQSYEPCDVTIHTTEQPDETNIVDGVCASGDFYVSMKCLEAKFRTDKSGIRNVGTVIFPSNEQNPEADISRFESDGLRGSRVDFGGDVSDYVMYTLSDGKKTYHTPVDSGLSYERFQLEGKWGIVRKIRGATGFMFAKDAKLLTSGEQGFSSNQPIDFYVKEGKGKVICPAETSLTIKEYGVKSIIIDGMEADVKSNSISHTIKLSEGEHEIELVYDENKKQQEIIASKTVHGAFDKMIAIDVSTGDVISGGSYHKELLKSGLRVIDGTSYVTLDFAADYAGFAGANAISLDGQSYIPLRQNAEANGYTVYWDSSEFILLVPENVYFDTNADIPLLGITSLIFDKVYQTSEPYMPLRADGISINGDNIENFDPSVYFYSVNVFEGTSIDSVSVDSDAYVTVIKPDTLPGTVEIILGNSGEKQTKYFVTVNTVPNGSILNVTASHIPQPENPPASACDGDLSTRWSADGTSCWIVFDLGLEKDITSVETAWYLGNTRVNFYDIEFSSDNKKWTMMFSGQSSGTTVETEKNEGTSGRARYVRIRCKGASTTNWNSLTECKINTR